MRMATTATRGYKTPFEIITGSIPNVINLRPFGTIGYVLLPSDQRLKPSASKPHLAASRAQPAMMIGYHDMFSTTYKMLTAEEMIIHSRNVTWGDLDKCGPKDMPFKPSQTEATSVPHSIEFELMAPVAAQAKEAVSNESGLELPPSPYMAQAADSPNELYGSPPHSPTLSEEFAREEPHIDISPHHIWSAEDSPPWEQWDQGTSPQPRPRPTYTALLTQMKKLDANVQQLFKEVYIATLDYNSPGEVDAFMDSISESNDHTTYALLAQYLALNAQSFKDGDWPKILASEDREEALNALDKEIHSLIHTFDVLEPILEGDPDYEEAQQLACSGRYIIARRRDGKLKARAVKQGFKEDLIAADGPDFNYYANVAKMDTVRATYFRRRRGNRKTVIRDAKCAYLQSHKYPKDHPKKYACFKHPQTSQWTYFRQKGPMYGENSAAVYWEETIAPWIIEQGFERGCNDQCIFYNAEHDLVVLLYVDDILMDGEQEDIDWFDYKLVNRFDCKDREDLTVDNPVDYIGLEMSMDVTYIYLAMEEYTIKMLHIMDMADCRPASTPIDKPIENNTPLPKHLRRQFMTGVGMSGWLVNTIRFDCAFTQSRISQHLANPTQGAFDALKHLMKYYKSTYNLCLRQPLHAEVSVRHLITGIAESEHHFWRFFSDTDFASNAEPQNKRRSQNCFVAVCDEAPIKWYSKVSSVAFAHPAIGEAHAEMSSAASEVYGASNACCDAMQLSYIVDELRLPFPMPFTLEIDNAAALAFAKHTAFKSKLKHIDCRQEWVKTLRDHNICKPVHVPTDLNLADLGTKINPKPIFERLRDRVMHRLPLP